MSIIPKLPVFDVRTQAQEQIGIIRFADDNKLDAVGVAIINRPHDKAIAIISGTQHMIIEDIPMLIAALQKAMAMGWNSPTGVLNRGVADIRPDYDAVFGTYDVHAAISESLTSERARMKTKTNATRGMRHD